MLKDPPAQNEEHAELQYTITPDEMVAFGYDTYAYIGVIHAGDIPGTFPGVELPEEVPDDLLIYYLGRANGHPSAMSPLREFIESELLEQGLTRVRIH